MARSPRHGFWTWGMKKGSGITPRGGETMEGWGGAYLGTKVGF